MSQVEPRLKSDVVANLQYVPSLLAIELTSRPAARDTWHWQIFMLSWESDRSYSESGHDADAVSVVFRGVKGAP